MTRSCRAKYLHRPRLEALEDRTLLSVAMVKDIGTTGLSSNPNSLLDVNGTLYFRATDVTHGEEIHRSDGTAAGTSLVKDLTPGAGSPSFGPFASANGRLFFTASSATGNGLFVSDGTEAGTSLIPLPAGKTVVSGSTISGTSSLLYFPVREGGVSKIWRTDGTAAGTAPLGDTFGDNTAAVAFRGSTLLAVRTALTASTLYFTDGTGAGTVQLQQFQASDSTGRFLIRDLTVVGDTAYFFATNGGDVWGLYKTDGTPNGTTLVQGGFAGTPSNPPLNLVNAQGTLFFSFGGALWKSDGTATGTVAVTGFIGTPPRTLAAVGNVVLFNAAAGNSAFELWRSDGTDAGTFRLTDPAAGPVGDMSSPVLFQGELYFSALDPAGPPYGLYKSDGTRGGRSRLRPSR
jgi:ELWxxDGT repeat protein